MSLVEEPVIRVKRGNSRRNSLAREKEVLGVLCIGKPVGSVPTCLPLVTTHQIVDLGAQDEETYVRLAGLMLPTCSAA